jgi:hypothetical protein
MARERQKTEAFKEQYALHSGIEATFSQGVRAFELRRSRYIGLAKTHLQHLLSRPVWRQSRGVRQPPGADVLGRLVCRALRAAVPGIPLKTVTGVGSPPFLEL